MIADFSSSDGTDSGNVQFPGNRDDLRKVIFGSKGNSAVQPVPRGLDEIVFGLNVFLSVQSDDSEPRLRDSVDGFRHLRFEKSGFRVDDLKGGVRRVQFRIQIVSPVFRIEHSPPSVGRFYADEPVCGIVGKNGMELRFDELFGPYVEIPLKYFSIDLFLKDVNAVDGRRQYPDAFFRIGNSIADQGFDDYVLMPVENGCRKKFALKTDFPKMLESGSGIFGGDPDFHPLERFSVTADDHPFLTSIRKRLRHCRGESFVGKMIDELVIEFPTGFLSSAFGVGENVAFGLPRSVLAEFFRNSDGMSFLGIGNEVVLGDDLVFQAPVTADFRSREIDDPKSSVT